MNDSSEREEDKSRGRWSLSIGLVHGIAGPSGILAVLPAVVLADAGKSTAYLVAFFVTSTAAMGIAPEKRISAFSTECALRNGAYLGLTCLFLITATYTQFVALTS